MADTIKFDLVTPERRLITTTVDEMVAEGILGQFGVLPGHANYVTSLEPGGLDYMESGKKQLIFISGGFIEVTLDDGIRIMADSAEFADDIDEERAKSSQERAQRRIADYDPSTQGVDIIRARAALARSLKRLETIGNI